MTTVLMKQYETKTEFEIRDIIRNKKTCFKNVNNANFDFIDFK